MNKKLILHDLPPDKIEHLLSGADGDCTVFPAYPDVHSCMGCFGCWFNTSGECAIDDRGKGFADMISRHSEFLVISRIVFGGLSPSVKTVIERCIGYSSPFFHIVNGEMHHVMRYETKPYLRYIFYGQNIGTREKEIALKLAAANALNFAAKFSVSFYVSVDEIEGL